MSAKLPIRLGIRERKGHECYGSNAVECLICPADENGANLGNCMATVSLGGPGGTDSSPQAVREFAALVSAAPEMLEALKAVEVRLTKAANAFYVSGKAKDLQAALDGWKVDAHKARDVVARAEGRTT